MHTIAFFKQQAPKFALSTAQLKIAIDRIDVNSPQTIITAQQALKQCRLNYKGIECFLSYFFPNQAMSYNSPPKFEAEEPFMEYDEPRGLQVIESILFDKDIAAKKNDLHEQIELVNSSASDLVALLYGFDATDNQVLESVRFGVTRIITLNITGFDAPILKSGIAESGESLNAIKNMLQPYLTLKSRYADSVDHYLNKSISFIGSNKDFDTFNRLGFLTTAALPMQHYLNLFIKEQRLEVADSKLSYDADNLFSPGALKIGTALTDVKVNKALVQLGRQLFFEKALSGNSARSCATCHQPEKYFTDALPKSLALDGHTSVQRNAPTLFYAGYQRAQFWDARVKTLEEQIKDVLVNPSEMNSVDKDVIKIFKKTKTYYTQLGQAFPAQHKPVLSASNIAGAIAAYIRTLQPFNSNFDQYIKGNRQALTPAQINGFNLFMGKAQCGTCHYAPLFNGLIPPDYQVSELEVLGTPATDNLDKPQYDKDDGRYATYPISFYKGAFKTPTVRNVSVTGPYMHNGSFTSLEKVMDFYNKGGGQGIGLNIDTQTLPATPLNLTQPEIADIINFMKSLTDKLPLDKQQKTNPIHIN